MFYIKTSYTKIQRTQKGGLGIVYSELQLVSGRASKCTRTVHAQSADFKAGIFQYSKSYLLFIYYVEIITFLCKLAQISLLLVFVIYYLYNLYNKFTRHKQVCLMRLRFEKYFSSRSLIKHACSQCDKVISKILVCILFLYLAKR